MGQVRRHAVLAGFILALCMVFAALLPTLSFAQEDELSATIRAALLTDPRAADLSQAEIASLVQALAAQAREEGVAPEDIVWQPEEPTFAESVQEQPASTCEGVPSFLCMLNDAFGFSGNDLTIPFALLASSLVLILVLLLMKRAHKNPTAPPPPLF